MASLYIDCFALLGHLDDVRALELSPSSHPSPVVSLCASGKEACLIHGTTGDEGPRCVPAGVGFGARKDVGGN